MNTEQADNRYDDLDTWPLRRSLRALVDANAHAVTAVEQALPALEQAASGIEHALSQGGRLVYLGAGTSGRLAVQDAAELLPTFGFDRTLVLLAGGADAQERAQEGAEDDQDAAVQAVDRAEVGPHDAVIGVAASGRTPFTVAGVRRATERGAFTVGIANNPHTPLLAAAAVGVLLATGPEVLAGSTRLAAGTAQKVALNALSTSVLVRLGGAYGNLMVGMQASNAKLRERATRIVAQASGQSEQQAKQALTDAHHNIRAATLMLAADVSLESAEALLMRSGQRVRDALAATRTKP